MSSKIEQLIDEIEEYVDSCKYQPLSNTKIIVNKEEIDELLRELRMKTPDEIKRYQKIISNKEAILSDARAKAEALINDATVHTNELQYTDDILANVENLINQTMRTTTEHYESFFGALNHYNDVINTNRVELNPPEPDSYPAASPEGAPNVGGGENLNLDLL